MALPASETAPPSWEWERRWAAWWEPGLAAQPLEQGLALAASETAPPSWEWERR